MLISAHQLNYLPYAGYFAKIIKSDAFMFIQKVQFEKKSWQNRNKILTKNGIVMLSVPVLSKDKFSQNIEEVRINNDTPWRSKHFKSIVLAYNKTPFFKRYIEFFEDIYQKEWEFLKDIDYAITLFFINELGIKTPLYYDKDFDLRGKKNDLLIDICKALKADTYLSNEGSADYVDINYLNAHHIEHYFCRYTEQTPPPLQQHTLPQQDKTMYLSMIDMLFNKGAQQSKMILENSLELSEKNSLLKEIK